MNMTLGAAETTVDSVAKLFTALLERWIRDSKHPAETEVLNKFAEHIKDGGELQMVAVDIDKQELFEQKLKEHGVDAYKLKSVLKPNHMEYVVADTDSEKIHQIVRELSSQNIELCTGNQKELSDMISSNEELLHVTFNSEAIEADLNASGVAYAKDGSRYVIAKEDYEKLKTNTTFAKSEAVEFGVGYGPEKTRERIEEMRKRRQENQKENTNTRGRSRQ